MEHGTMEGQKERNSEEPEDIPSDFFDDFAKEEFIEGLSVIDSWGDNGQDKRRASRYDAETLEGVSDLRELIGEGKKEENGEAPRKKRRGDSESNSRLDDYIKPGSRRDPSKTNAAIRKDKEVKVKELLAKHLESTDDLRPPGTELDNYFSAGHQEPNSREVELQPPTQQSRARVRSTERRKESIRRRSPRRSPKRSPHRSPYRSLRRSPIRGRRSPDGYQHWRHRSPRRFSPPARRRNRELSPLPRYRRSPLRRSPMRRSPYRERRSRSDRRSISLSPPPPASDNFLYPSESIPLPGFGPPGYPMGMGPPGMFMGPRPVDYPSPGYPYPSGPGYPDNFGVSYEYSGPPVPMPQLVSLPQPVPAPMIPLPAPVMVPSVSQIPSPSISSNPPEKTTPFDALAQLVAEGKLSKEDYLKLTPNKSGITATSTHTRDRVEVLNRCHQALQQLAKLRIPSKLVMGNMVINEPKALGSRYCSPLKRATAVEFLYTKKDASATVQHNKHIIDTIINVIGLNHVVAAPKRKAPKNMRDSSTQTTKSFCDVCAIRDSTRLYDTATATESEHFTCTVHTQVVEQDLISSKAVFNPSGSAAGGGPVSIAHLTPAQLVSQLAARAKTLKQTEPTPAFERRSQYDYEGRGGGGQQYHNNYRY